MTGFIMNTSNNLRVLSEVYSFETSWKGKMQKFNLKIYIFGFIVQSTKAVISIFNKNSDFMLIY